MTTHTLSKLGLVLSGTNADLAQLPKDKDDESEGKDGGGGDGSDKSDGDDSDDDGDDDGSGDDSDEDGDEDGDDDADGSGSSKGNKGNKGKGKGKSKGSKGDKSDEDGDDDADGSSGSKDGKDKSDKSDPSKDGDAKDGKGDDGDDGEPNTDDSSAPHKGGGYDPNKGKAIAQALLDAIKGGMKNGLKDNNSALGDAIDAKKTEEDKSCQPGEQVWRPSCPDNDTISYVRVTEHGKNSAAQMREAVRVPTSALRARMRTKFLLARRPQVIHGVRQGMDLSERRMVDSFIELRSGRRPSRPDWARKQDMAVTLSAAVVIDESSSMEGALQVAAAKGALVVADALDVLGSPCLVLGPRDGPWARRSPAPSDHPYHRHSSVVLDIFKDWHEKMETVWPRFGHVQAMGGTPLEDGIQYALQELNTRTERFRVVLVITDGCPDNERVCWRQIRLATESGVFVVGVGIGDVPGVSRLFPLSVVVQNIDELPNALMRVLELIIFPKRGQQVILDGRVSAKFQP